MKGAIVTVFVAIYGFGMRAFLDGGISFFDAPIVFSLSVTAVCLVIGFVSNRHAARAELQSRALRDRALRRS